MSSVTSTSSPSSRARFWGMVNGACTVHALVAGASAAPFVFAKFSSCPPLCSPSLASHPRLTRCSLPPPAARPGDGGARPQRPAPRRAAKEQRPSAGWRRTQTKAVRRELFVCLLVHPDKAGRYASARLILWVDFVPKNTHSPKVRGRNSGEPKAHTHIGTHTTHPGAVCVPRAGDSYRTLTKLSFDSLPPLCHP